MSNQLIEHTVSFVKEQLREAEGGHDWWHIYRVWQSAKRIAAKEKADLLVVELGALLHDIADSKFHEGDETIGPRKAREFLESHEVDESIINQVIEIIEKISFKGGFNSTVQASIELKVVQDADRLDAIGAIGIARAFNYGGFKNRAMYDPEIKPAIFKNREEYKKSNGPTINHFYEKLLLLKDRMNTDTGKEMAATRHDFMVAYLDEFYKEWEGEE